MGASQQNLKLKLKYHGIVQKPWSHVKPALTNAGPTVALSVGFRVIVISKSRTTSMIHQGPSTCPVRRLFLPLAV